MEKEQIEQSQSDEEVHSSKELPQQAEGKKTDQLSKKQMKKIIKKEKWQKEKLIKRKQKREKEKEKKKLKKQQQQQQQQKQKTQEQKNQQKQQFQLLKKRKEDYQQKQKQGVKVVIDLQFYDLMTEKEQNSLIKQLGYCHSVNRKKQKCFQYILTSATLQRQKLFAERYNADKWGITMEVPNILELYPKQKLVYLTGDATEDIEEFDPELIYIIGGIVDHNRLKKITYNYAVENGIAVKRLPMKTVHLKASVHLAVNHVWEWMLLRYNGAGWDQALKAVIPLRKLQNYNQE